VTPEVDREGYGPTVDAMRAARDEELDMLRKLVDSLRREARASERSRPPWHAGLIEEDTNA
jgi:hypothetical protein